jgi:hypothetical protein
MNEIYAYTIGVDATRRLAHSALPDAPVVADAERPVATRSRRWTAARLYSVARATQHLAHRVDPVCATR